MFTTIFKTSAALGAGTVLAGAVLVVPGGAAPATGRIAAWGDNYSGALGNNSTTSSRVAVAVDRSGVLAGKTMSGISVGGYHSCAVADGRAYCWGYNDDGTLGNNSTTESLVPVRVNTGGVLHNKTVTAISAGYEHTCVVADGRAFCWGPDNHKGELGNNSRTGSPVLHGQLVERTGDRAFQDQAAENVGISISTLDGWGQPAWSSVW